MLALVLNLTHVRIAVRLEPHTPFVSQCRCKATFPPDALHEASIKGSVRTYCPVCATGDDLGNSDGPQNAKAETESGFAGGREERGNNAITLSHSTRRNMLVIAHTYNGLRSFVTSSLTCRRRRLQLHPLVGNTSPYLLWLKLSTSCRFP